VRLGDVEEKPTCAHTTFEIIRDVGEEFGENYREQLHLDKCSTCDGWRLRSWISRYDRPGFTFLGEWQTGKCPIVYGQMEQRKRPGE
jgi:hypothetical protein